MDLRHRQEALDAEGNFVRREAVRATDFEYRHQTLIHLLIVAISFLTYLIDRDDIVWALVRGQPHAKLLERLLFAVATLFIGAATVVRTWARAYPWSPAPGYLYPVRRDGPYRHLRNPQQLGNLLFAIGLGSLAPFWGFVFLVAGEAILFFRLTQREREAKNVEGVRPDTPVAPPPQLLHRPLLELPMWGKAFRQESAKWGLFLTMIVFTLLLRDGVAEVLAAASVIVWVVLNCDSFPSLMGR
jgi:protein-S-isoprenylcysteine O-methyltransferase Ste14